MRLVVVDDNDLWRASLVAALTSRGFSVLADVDDGPNLQVALRELQDTEIDVAILDLRLPPTWSDEGISLARALRKAHPKLGVLLLSGYEQDVQLHYASRALDNLAGPGGMGYLFKDRTDRASLASAVHRVANGDLVVDSLFAQEAAEQYRKHEEIAGEFTQREIDVLELLVQGNSNREIAATLHLSVPVIERHLTSIFRQIAPEAEHDGFTRPSSGRRENRRVLAVLEWLRRTGRLS
jgi:DNA-binding NarL/FixJ family response regulator